MEEITELIHNPAQRNLVFRRNEVLTELTNVDKLAAEIFFILKEPNGIEEANLRFGLTYNGELREGNTNIVCNLFKSSENRDYLSIMEEEDENFELTRQITYTRIHPEMDGLGLVLRQGDTAYTVAISNRILAANGLAIMRDNDHYETFVKMNRYTIFSGCQANRYRYFNEMYWIDEL